MPKPTKEQIANKVLRAGKAYKRAVLAYRQVPRSSSCSPPHDWEEKELEAASAEIHKALVKLENAAMLL